MSYSIIGDQMKWLIIVLTFIAAIGAGFAKHYKHPILAIILSAVVVVTSLLGGGLYIQSRGNSEKQNIQTFDSDGPIQYMQDSPGAIQSMGDVNVDKSVKNASVELEIVIAGGRSPRPFNGTVNGFSIESFLTTKSGETVRFVSAPSSIRMIRDNRSYSFVVKYDLPNGYSVFRNSPEEIVEARKISVPLARFIDIITKKGINNPLRINLAAVKYFVNGSLVKKSELNKLGQAINRESVLYLDF